MEKAILKYIENFIELSEKKQQQQQKTTQDCWQSQKEYWLQYNQKLYSSALVAYEVPF